MSRQQITCSDLTTSAFPEQKYHFFSKLFNSYFLLYFPAVCFGCFKRKPLANMCKHTPNPFAEVPWYFGIGEQSGGKLTASLLIYVKVWNRDISSLHPLKILVRSNSQHSLFLHQEGFFFFLLLFVCFCHMALYLRLYSTGVTALFCLPTELFFIFSCS